MNFDPRAVKDFNLSGDAIVHLHGVGGRTVSKLRQHDLGFVSSLRPDVIILEIATNDLVDRRPEVVGSEIDEFVHFLLDSFSVCVIGVCEVIPHFRVLFFNAAAPILNQYINRIF